MGGGDFWGVVEYVFDFGIDIVYGVVVGFVGYVECGGVYVD